MYRGRFFTLWKIYCINGIIVLFIELPRARAYWCDYSVEVFFLCVKKIIILWLLFGLKFFFIETKKQNIFHRCYFVVNGFFSFERVNYYIQKVIALVYFNKITLPYINKSFKIIIMKSVLILLFIGWFHLQMLKPLTMYLSKILK